VDGEPQLVGGHPTSTLTDLPVGFAIADISSETFLSSWRGYFHLEKF